MLGCSLVFAQQETLISGDFTSGGFGGPVIKIGPVYGETAALIGGRGGWIVDHRFIIGGGGYGLISEVPSKAFPELEMNMGYGGVELEYIHRPNKLTHWSFMVLIGGGGAGFSERNSDSWDADYDYDNFFIVEPSALMMLNVTPFFRLGAGGSYRFIRGINRDSELTDSDLGGAAFVIMLKFGTF